MLFLLEYSMRSERFAKLRTPVRFEMSVMISLRLLSGFQALGCDERYPIDERMILMAHI